MFSSRISASLALLAASRYLFSSRDRLVRSFLSLMFLTFTLLPRPYALFASLCRRILSSFSRFSRSSRGTRAVRCFTWTAPLSCVLFRDIVFVSALSISMLGDAVVVGCACLVQMPSRG